MTSITASSTLTQQLYTRLFDSLNTDGDDALSVGEIGASGAANVDSTKVFNTLDANGDGRVVRAEMTPSSAFGADTLNSLIGAQAEDDPASFSTAKVAELFARADVDGDGALNATEMEAESDLRRAANLDAGYIAGPIFMPMDKNGDGVFTQDEVHAGRLGALALPAGAIHFFDEAPVEVQKQVQAARERAGLPALKPLTEAEKTAQREQWAADKAERASGPEGTVSFLSREIDGFRAKASTAYAAQTQVSGALSQRLLNQILGDGWKTEASA